MNTLVEAYQETSKNYIYCALDNNKTHEYSLTDVYVLSDSEIVHWKCYDKDYTP